MLEMGFSSHIVDLIKRPHTHQSATVRTTHSLTIDFRIEQGVRQGCILSPHLFNIYSEVIMRNALEGFEGTVKIGGRSITNLTYAYDIVLVGGSIKELQNIVNRVHEATMSAKSLGTLPVIYAIDELQNPLPRKTMLFEGHMTSTFGRSDACPNS